MFVSYEGLVPIKVIEILEGSIGKPEVVKIHGAVYHVMLRDQTNRCDGCALTGTGTSGCGIAPRCNGTTHIVSEFPDGDPRLLNNTRLGYLHQEGKLNVVKHHIKNEDAWGGPIKMVHEDEARPVTSKITTDSVEF